MIIETKQIFIDTWPSHGTQLTLMGPLIIHPYIKSKGPLYAHYRLHACLCPEYLCMRYSKVAYWLLLSFLSLFSLDPVHMFLQKDWGKEGSLLQAVKSILTLSFLSLFSLHPNHLLLKIYWGKETSLLHSVKKYSYFVFSFLIFPPPDPSVSPKRLRKWRMVLTTAGGKKVLPTLSFLSLFCLDLIHLFLKKDWEKRWMWPKHILVLPFTDFVSCYAHLGPIIVPKMCIAWHKVYNGQHQNLGQGNGQLGEKEACGTLVLPAMGTLRLFTIFPSHIASSPPRHHLPEHSSP
jgi:hypothetical protein